MYKKLYAMLVLSAAVLVGCDNDSDDDDGGEDVGTVEATFSPFTGAIPTTNGLLFSGSTDLTVNIPGGSALPPPAIAQNKLDGFSTTAPITIDLSHDIDGDTLVAGDTVHLIHACVLLDPNQAMPPVAVGTHPVAPATETTNLRSTNGFVDPSQYTVEVNATNFKQILVKPNSPLLAMNPSVDMHPDCPGFTGIPGTSGLPYGNGYIAVVTSGVKTVNGSEFGVAPLYALAKTAAPLHDGTSATTAGTNAGLNDQAAAVMEGVRQIVNAHLGFAFNIGGIAADDVLISTHFPTQSIGTVLGAAASGIQSANTPIAATRGNDIEVNGQVIGHLFSAKIDTTFFSNPANPLDSHWTTAAPAGGNLTWNNTTPAVNAGNQIDVRIAVPAAPGLKRVVIFQHGIGASKEVAAAIEPILIADQSTVVISIDMYLHGSRAVNGVDSTLAFMNLQNLITARDNIRQASIDLMHLNCEIPQINIPHPTSAPLVLDSTRVHYIGHSLGGIVGTLFLANVDNTTANSCPNVQASVLAMPGGGIPKLLDGSPGFAPTVAGLLAQSGIESGTDAYEQFLRFAQSALDSADPINYIDDVLATTRPVYLLAEHLDPVVPNDVKPGDLGVGSNHMVFVGSDVAGTLPLSEGFTRFDAYRPSRLDTEVNKAFVLFSSIFQATPASSVHGTILLPAGGVVQKSAEQYIKSNGTCLNTSGGDC